MSKVNAGWTVVEPSLPILTYLYSFGPGLAHALAVGGAGGLIVVSPPCNVSEAAFAELEKHGKVVALVASNAFHHMGIPAWKARFPDAQVFAPAQAVARVAAKSKIADVKPLSDAGAIAGPNVELIDMPHYKTGEVLVRLRAGDDVIWYTTDVLMNMKALPKGFPMHQIFKWTKSAPGLKLNGVSPLFMMKDKLGVHRWLRKQAEAVPPTLLLPAHGDPLRLGPNARELIDILPSG